MKWLAITKIWMGMADCNDDYQILKRMMMVSIGKQSAKILLSTERAPALSHLWFRQPSRRPTINFHKSISRPTRDFPQPWTLGGRASDNLPLTILLSSFSCFFSPSSLSLAFFPPFLFFLSLTFSPPSILLCFHFILSSFSWCFSTPFSEKACSWWCICLIRRCKHAHLLWQVSNMDDELKVCFSQSPWSNIMQSLRVTEKLWYISEGTSITSNTTGGSLIPKAYHYRPPQLPRPLLP